MKQLLTVVLTFSLVFFSILYTSAQNWQPLLDSKLSKWDTYLSYSHHVNYDGKVPKDSAGNPIPPVGYNNDQNKVFSIISDSSDLVLRISGEIYGAIFTKAAYENYHLKLQVKWGTKKHEPRKKKLKDSGILYHSNGPAGAEYWRSWMLSQEFQIMEGHMGDYWCQANGMIDIKSFPSEGIMSCVADESAAFQTFGRGGDGFCMRSGNFETRDGWTTLELICFEGKSLHIVNGHVVMILQNSRYKDENGQEIPMQSGKIQLQSEAAEVFFKDIMIIPISSMPAEYKSLYD